VAARFRSLAAVALAASLVWLASLGAAPIVRAHTAEWADAFRVVAGLVYLTGSLVCHQRPERSFQLEGVPLPVCARCTGLYAGASLGLLAVVSSAIVRRRMTIGARGWLLLAALPTALSVALEWMGMPSPMFIRTVAALPLGAATAGLIGAWLSADS